MAVEIQDSWMESSKSSWRVKNNQKVPIKKVVLGGIQCLRFRYKYRINGLAVD